MSKGIQSDSFKCILNIARIFGSNIWFFGSGVGFIVNKGNEYQTKNNDLKNNKWSWTGLQRASPEREALLFNGVCVEASRLELVLASAAVTLGHKVHDTVALCRPEHECAGHALVLVTKVMHKLSFWNMNVLTQEVGESLRVQFSHSSSSDSSLPNSARNFCKLAAALSQPDT